MKIANIEWLEDTALRLLCVFALDRFGDYVSDEVIFMNFWMILHHVNTLLASDPDQKFVN